MFCLFRPAPNGLPEKKKKNHILQHMAQLVVTLNHLQALVFVSKQKQKRKKVRHI